MDMEKCLLVKKTIQLRKSKFTPRFLYEGVYELIDIMESNVNRKPVELKLYYKDKFDEQFWVEIEISKSNYLKYCKIISPIKLSF
jgi:hypothetical protein